MSENWPDRNKIMEMGAAFMVPCVLGAAAELDLFTLLDRQPLSAEAVAEHLDADPRATAMLLDSVAALRLLRKADGVYSLPEPLRPWLVEGTPETTLPMIRHRMCILRGWAELARTAKSGKPPERKPSIRGAEADRAAFIAAMHSVSGPIADELVARLGPPEFTHLLDVGGASGTWTLAFLRAVPEARATIFDLPDAIDQARERIAATELAERIELVPGDFYEDDLPGGADLAWVSAIAHQHDREHNRALYAKVHAALVPGGQIAIRDIVMQSDRIHPADGALFAINMLVNTETGGTFTFDEFADDLRTAGFTNPRLAVPSEDMNAVVMAVKAK